MVDEFILKPRKQYAKSYIYLYNQEGEFIGKYLGKEIMPIINEHSWVTIRDCFRYKKGWYKNYYLSMEKVEKIPEKPNNGIKVDIYDKYGNFIETLNTIKEVKEKYKVPSSKIKNIQ